MVQLDVSLTTLGLVLWSGMLIIAGSVWVLASQVRRVADVIDRHATRVESLGTPARPAARARVEQRPVHALPNAQARLDEVYAANPN